MKSQHHSTQMQGAPRKRWAVRAVDSLHAHEGMANLMPTLARTAALQQECATVLPEMFGKCTVLHLDAGRLSLAAPNAALAARLKQKLPILQDSLCAAGWQISAINLKVQPPKNTVESIGSNKQGLSPQALGAFATLGDAIEKTPQNEALRMAIRCLLQHHQNS